MADDVISSAAVYYVGMDAHVKFGDSIFNGDRIIRLVAGWSHFTHLHAVFNCSLQPTGSSKPRHIWQMYVYVTDYPS